MKQKYGILLFELDEVVIRIYESDDGHWKLLHYQSEEIAILKNRSNDKIVDIVEILTEYFSSDFAQHVGEWRTCARFLPQPFIQAISKATGLTIENLTHLREQELLCKGMFTELW
jgi:hypothetical protein